MHIITLTQDSNSLQNIFSVFYTKSNFKNGRKFIGAFEKRADDVTYGGPILSETSKVVRK